jgi:glutamine synthetase
LATARSVSELIDSLRTSLDALVAQNAETGGDDVHEKSLHMRDQIIPAMAAVRSSVDRLEKLVPDDLWPVPTYRDMLFVK